MKRWISDLLINLKIWMVPAPSVGDLERSSLSTSKNNNIQLPENETSVEFVELPKIFTDPRAFAFAPQTRYLKIIDRDVERKLAYNISGDINASKVLLCLPGLLETKDTFSVLHSYFWEYEGCKVVSLDFPGRGDSESIPEADHYKMSLYLSDICSLIEMLINEGSAATRFTVLGTSMGGVLAMYLTQHYEKRISQIILNDIALTVNWAALYSLYKSMKNEMGYKEVKQLAKELMVKEKAISDVQLPGHFDLSYRADVWGMNFHEAMESYAGKVSLIYGSESRVCSKQQVSSAKTAIPNLVTFRVEGAGHPVPFTAQVCDFIRLQMGIK